ncbi:respiratory nitrate reductase subunit gamma [Kocuria sp. JC486]|uniref:respiratory nitrate reductase subunit gamma n=1 Tax=Kocuria sp. JC486 TaxID=1970736 RepID=UPI00142305F1|nr:respiratory nitrate reductase subunit gamma [Kocuria sp. JC486]NHU85815.1 respiratory nitrate reductase subunit gamma [Kocuria sp. JC486]
MSSVVDILLWGVLPYVVLLVVIGGTIWRYKFDQFGWTTRSSQLYESRLLRIGSPLFHFGILAVLIGHIVGLIIPKNWTDAVGLSEHAYHILALSTGTFAGIGTFVGLALLIYRRRKTGPVFMATTNNDKIMYVMLVVTLIAGLATTIISVFDHSVPNYRETVSPWFRSIWILQPDVAAMAAAGLSFKVHVLFAFTLFMAWPFTRLVHAFTAPLHYLFRPYIVYRSRDRVTRSGSVPARRGWDPVGTQDRDRGARRGGSTRREKTPSGR